MMNLLNYSFYFGLFINGLVVIAIVLGLVYLHRISNALQEIARKMNEQESF